MRRGLLPLAAVGAMILVVGVVGVTPAEAPDLDKAICHEFDRTECLRDCRWRFLGTPFSFSPEEQRGRGWGGAGSRGGYWAYTSCVNECEKRAWQDFDRHFEDK